MLDLKQDSWGVNSTGIALPVSFSRHLEKGEVGSHSRLHPYGLGSNLELSSERAERGSGLGVGRFSAPVLSGSVCPLTPRPPTTAPRPAAREREFVYVGTGGEIEVLHEVESNEQEGLTLQRED